MSKIILLPHTILFIHLILFIQGFIVHILKFLVSHRIKEKKWCNMYKHDFKLNNYMQ
jgi:hypothetical protein